MAESVRMTSTKTNLGTKQRQQFPRMAKLFITILDRFRHYMYRKYEGLGGKRLARDVKRKIKYRLHTKKRFSGQCSDHPRKKNNIV